MEKNIFAEFDKHIPEIEKKIGYSFKDRALLRQAFTRTSFCNENRGISGVRPESNEVLEFFGDSVLSTAIITQLLQNLTERYEYGIHTELKEGDFSNIRSKLSDKTNLSETTRGMGIAKHLLMGEGDAKQGIENEPSVMEDLFESIIGAIYIDSGRNLAAVMGIVMRLLDIQEYLNVSKAPLQSFKNALQEWCADKKHKRPAPIYKTISESGPDHKKIYERACYIGDKVYGVGTGKNQKIADTSAAEQALTALKEEYERMSPKKDISLNEASLQKLKERAAKEKKPSPEFRDLGETPRSTATKKEYEVECRYASLSATGKGETKRDAKISAAGKILGMLEKKTDSAKQQNQKKTHQRKIHRDVKGTEDTVKTKIKHKSQGSVKKKTH